ncbi:MAG: type I polyketide synthase, partial [Micromonosporaceae bacterium]
MAETSQRDAIAVVGMACRFPGARNVDQFWRNMLDGTVSIVPLDDDAMRAAGVPDKDLQDPNYVKAGALIDDVEWLDAAFFGLSQREAEVLDPQHRVMLEVSHTALQHAGHEPSRYPGRIGVYAGARHNAYRADNIERNAKVNRAAGDLLATVSNDTDYVATGVAYRLNLRGPAITSVTACSTSLVATHQAYRALLADECDLALAGGVEIAFPVVRGYRYAEGSITSPDGQVRPFDANARGTVFGNGCGVVVLKRLGDAIADGDTIHAVVLSSAINNDGAEKGAFAAPSETGQARVIEAALRQAGVNPETIGYVEAHGTGTIVGDPLEIRALTNAYRRHTDRVGYCAIASAKANVGHLGAAAGVCGMIKAIHCVRDGVLPPAVNLEETNPAIDFESSPFQLHTTVREWADTDGPRRAGVSSFGIGGTNAHLILEQPPRPPEPERSPLPYQLIALSARTTTALDTASGQLAEHLKRPVGAELADVAYTLNVGRASLAARRVAVARDTAHLVEQLEAGGLPTVTVPVGADRQVGFLFPGQGSQYVGMGRGLYQHLPAFKSALDWCAERLRETHDLDLFGLLYPEGPGDDAAARLSQTGATQPALFSVEYALAQQLREWGVEPGVLLGHSVGEYVAACLSGVMRAEDALRLIADRGALMQQQPTGSMLAVMLPEEHLLPQLPPEVDLAAVNAPGACTVSGEDRVIRELQQTLAMQGIGYRQLHTSHAFHSRMMDPILETFRERVAAVPLSAPQIPFLSNLTGGFITAEQAVDPDYWVRHLRSCVRFSDALATLVEAGHVLAEVGPGRTLTTLVNAHQSQPSPGRPGAVTTMPAPDQRDGEADDLPSALRGLGTIWASGAAVDWDRFWSPQRRSRIPLPGYPYERERYWVDPDETIAGVEEEAGPYYLPVWRETDPPLADPAAATADDAHWVLFAAPGDARLA